jgi:K+-transporting ATPase ATPase C chain
MRTQFRPALVCLILLTLITGLIYPLVVTAIARVAFAQKANGSVIVIGGRAVGSELIGQAFTDPKYFWPRPSATGPVAYNASGGSGSNLSPTNPAQIDAVKQRTELLRAADAGNSAAVPVDLVTASASGLDPHISVAAAEYQLARVARVRGISPEQLRRVVDRFTEGSTLGLLGEPRVNVLLLNLELDHPTPLAAATQSGDTSAPMLYRWRGFLPERR